MVATNIYIPGDCSSTAFFVVAATLIPVSDIFLNSVGINPTRTGLLDFLKRMGAKITLYNQSMRSDDPVVDIHVCSAELEAITVE